MQSMQRQILNNSGASHFSHIGPMFLAEELGVQYSNPWARNLGRNSSVIEVIDGHSVGYQCTNNTHTENLHQLEVFLGRALPTC